jgi:predicted membrane-bound spermidine synthase
MAGLAFGAFLATRMLGKIKRRYEVFCGLEWAQFGLLLVSAWGLIALHRFFLQGAMMIEAPKVVLFLINVVAGVLVGSEFPVANREAVGRAGDGIATVGGRFYALDLAGAWLGTLLVSVLLIPLIGLGTTLLFAAALKACSLFYLYRSR